MCPRTNEKVVFGMMKVEFLNHYICYGLAK